MKIAPDEAHDGVSGQLKTSPASERKLRPSFPSFRHDVKLSIDHGICITAPSYRDSWLALIRCSQLRCARQIARIGSSQ
ncbi:hypothetical protein CY34DRAFT_799483 [Suillus luteus UH-Slu-Lm8-n1]|uniref:Uncharacterized protein n=1 Tax=Suillus luteus UH-Slu-Lm8-n1 TaxID=930992 RepID=A0A0D0AAN2_9AGAM|nr:hypothetical protein CY34DRAFT_799483 [Suillus luteus UH-Slu-Lm8-n1]